MAQEMGRIYTPRCIQCGKDGSIIAPMEDILRWLGPNPPHVQDCFPTLSKDAREQILSGVHPKCWNEIFPEESDRCPTCDCLMPAHWDGCRDASATR